MAFTFRIFFSGLCVLVPDKVDNPTSAQVLLVNLLLPRQLRRKKRDDQGKETAEHEILDPHFPVLIYRNSGDPGRPADFTPRSGTHADRNVYLLLHDELEIRPDGNDPENAAIDVSSTGNRALDRIAKMAEVFPGHERINPVLLSEPLRPEGRVVSRIRGLAGGKLFTADVSPEKIKIEPTGFGSTFVERQIAVRLAWEIRCDTHMVLRWRRFDRDSETMQEAGDLTWDGSAGDPVEILIENREIDLLIGVPDDYPVARALADFEVFFPLAEQPPTTSELPATIPIPLSGGGPGGQSGTLHGGKCPPTLMI